MSLEIPKPVNPKVETLDTVQPINSSVRFIINPLSLGGIKAIHERTNVPARESGASKTSK